MVVVLGLALLSEVAIGLDTVLEAVELCPSQYKFAQWRSGIRYWPLYALLRRFRASNSVHASQTYLPARVGDLATGLAD
jgi:hypothetical protein